MQEKTEEGEQVAIEGAMFVCYEVVQGAFPVDEENLKSALVAHLSGSARSFVVGIWKG